MSKPLLRADSIHKYYAMGTERLHVLRGCGVEVNDGEFVAIMGKSGSGKSTLLHILGALDTPAEGEVHFEGEPVFKAENGLVQIAAKAQRAVRFAEWLLVWLLKLSVVIVPALIAISLMWFPGMVVRLPLLLLFFVLYTVLRLIELGLDTVTEHHRNRLRRERFGFVFQFYHLLPELSVLENVLLPEMVDSSTWAWWGGRRARARANALVILERVGLAGRLKHRPAELSGGERQRVAIARALVHRPRILFADEPTGNLDAETGASLMGLLRGLHKDGQTMVMVTHDPTIAQQADRTLVLERGRLGGEG